MAEITRNTAKRFWETKTLEELTKAEWESLCDGCGLCCLQKLQDDETDIVYYTRISCQYLDIGTCRCKVYDERFDYLPECLDLSPQTFQAALPWLPPTCSYKRVYEGLPLTEWHPLLAENTEDRHLLGHTASAFAISEKQVPEEDWEDYLIDIIQLED